MSAQWTLVQHAANGCSPPFAKDVGSAPKRIFMANAANAKKSLFTDGAL
ncbi:hypothetical protein RGAI101_2774 [Roseobacter sp. GAI101]|nr:hypothetical protein RGAI101_2774 [Roseobacter sp. GAI101]